MFIGGKLMTLGAVLAFSANSAYAGPCNTASRDAGSGNVPGYTGQTTGSTATDTKEASADICDEQGLGEYRNVIRRREASDAERGYRCRSVKGDQARALCTIAEDDLRHARANRARAL
jgi:hypothetical protein